MHLDDLDAVLDRSRTDVGPLKTADSLAMLADARLAAGPARGPRRRRVGLGVAAALALVLGGGGVAAASGLVTWPAGFEDPDAEYAFELPSGRACEFRLLVAPVDAEAGSDRDTAELVQRAATEWLRSGGLVADWDLPAGRVEADRILAEQGDVGMTIVLTADGWLEDAAAPVDASGSDAPDSDVREAFGVDRAIRAALAAHLDGAGYPDGSWDFATDGGVKCAAE